MGHVKTVFEVSNLSNKVKIIEISNNFYFKTKSNKKVLLRERKRHRPLRSKYSLCCSVEGVPRVPPPPSTPGPGGTPSRPGLGVTGVPHPDLVEGYPLPTIQTWSGDTPSKPGWLGGTWGTPHHHPDLGWGTPSLLRPGMRYPQTLDGVPPLPRPGMGYPPT